MGNYRHSIMLTILGSVAGVQASNDAKSPNIIYILCDDLGIGDVSSYNSNSKINTPNIDILSESGVRFTDYHSASSVSTPTRYGILTGRYAWRTPLKQGVLYGYDKNLIESGRETVASFLKNEAYNTAVIGKWHLGLCWANIDAGQEKVDYSKTITNGPNDFGFDYSYCLAGSLDMPPYVYLENGKALVLPRDTFAEAPEYIKGVAAHGFKHIEVLDNFTAKAVQYIKVNAKTGKPFFLYFPLTAPHRPVLPTKQFQGKSGLSSYGDFVLMCDNVVKQVVIQLKKSGVYDNTLIVFTSDNGCDFGGKVNISELNTKGHFPNDIYRGAKTDVFEGGNRVPFIVSWPNKIKHNVSDKLICSTDFFRTIADLRNEMLPENVAEDSYSFASELGLDTRNSPQRESIVLHSYDGSFVIRKSKWKLIMCSHSGGWSFPRSSSVEAKSLPKMQLYNIDEDPTERINEYNKYPEVVSELTELLTKYVEEGRSTVGTLQQNTGPKYWKQLTWMNAE